MNKKNFIFYFFAILVFVGLVLIKQKSITKKNEKEPVTFYSSWKTDGKPVVVKKAQISNMETKLKMTLLFDSNNVYVGHLPKAFLKGLSLDSQVYIHFKDQKILCKILEIGSSLDLDSGMYLVKIYCPEKLADDNAKYLAEIEVSGFKDVVILPFDSINMEEEMSFVWVVKEGKAHKQFITLEERNSKGIIAKGIDESDLLIIKGSSSIKENDFLKLNYEN